MKRIMRIKAHKSAYPSDFAYPFVPESFQWFFHECRWRHGISELSEFDDASDWLASGSHDGARLAMILEAFKNMRISAYAAALMGQAG